MGKLKEKLLNNLSEDQMEDIFGISSFEYVELMSKYKDDESYVPTEGEVEDIEKLVEEYYQSKEFQESIADSIRRWARKERSSMRREKIKRLYDKGER